MRWCILVRRREIVAWENIFAREGMHGVVGFDRDITKYHSAHERSLL